MKASGILISTIIIILSAAFPRTAAGIELPAFLTDNMVMQQNSTLTIPGKTTPGATVRINGSWSDECVTTKAGADGTFSARLSTPAAGGPFSITLCTGDEEELTLNNVLSGEVWLCSGQSNMEFPVEGWATVMGHDTLVPMANHPYIRLLQVTKQTAHTPQADCRVNMGGWVECNPATVKGFSAIAYLYARELSQKLRVPVGVIDATWGGTPAEAWTSFDGVKTIDGFQAETDAMERCGFDTGRLSADYEKRLAQWMALANAQSEGDALPSGTMPTGINWENSVLPAAFDGIVWLSRSIDIPEEAAGKPLTLHLGAIDDEDVTYFNGVEIARGSGYDTPRVYTAPASLVKAGQAEIKCRVTDFGGGGGFNGGDRMRAKTSNGTEIPLEGKWDYRVAVDFTRLPARPVSVSGPGYPTVLYNAMIHPLAAMPVKGVIWYQGCANVGRADQYGPLFRRLITDWRQLWKQPGMPFYFVQLAGYLQPSFCQPDSEWAALRAAQADALELPATGMAVAIDLGDPSDIHPRNKQGVAHRLALLAFDRCYNQDVECEAPRLTECTTDGNRMRLRFDKEITTVTPAVTGFIIAGKDGMFHPADARLTDPRTVELHSSKVSHPAAVRYNWADCPNGALYGHSGLPVAPFATDRIKQTATDN